MVFEVTLGPPSMRQDGFGTRVVEETAADGRVERLRLSPALATPGAEQAIRARAAHLTSLSAEPISRVLRVDRKGAALSMVSQVPVGVTLSDLLAALEFGTLTVSDDELLELAATIVAAAGTMHQALGTLAHGGLSPAHVVLTREGRALFTGAVFGDAIQTLRCNREHIWREFGLTVPASAGSPRFDQRGDVAQLGGLVLAIAHRRSLRREEYPRGMDDLVVSTSFGLSAQAHSRLQTWLQDALQLHGRVVFDSCVDAARKFKRLLPKGCGDEAGAFALRTAILQLCGDPVDVSSATSPSLVEWQFTPARSKSRAAAAHRR